MDELIRRLERLSVTGDPEAHVAWKAALRRAGLPVPPDPKPPNPNLLTPVEEIQEDFDETWWHGNTGRKCGLWGHGGCRFWDVDFKSAVYKAHHKWGHRGGGENSKRKTLRSHRDGRRK